MWDFTRVDEFLDYQVSITHLVRKSRIRKSDLLVVVISS
jgi:hypothetical protein